MRWVSAGRDVEAVVFDLDGTLYSFDAGEHIDYLAVAHRCLVEVAGLDDVRAALLLRRLDAGSVTELLESCGVRGPEWAAYRERHWSGPRRPSPAPEVAAALVPLAAALPLALATNSSDEQTVELLDAIGVPADVFRVRVTSDLGLSPKPAPEVVLHVATVLRLHPASLFGVGDRWAVDVQPLVDLGGGGVEVRGPQDLGVVCARLLASGGPRGRLPA